MLAQQPTTTLTMTLQNKAVKRYGGLPLYPPSSEKSTLLGNPKVCSFASLANQSLHSLLPFSSCPPSVRLVDGHMLHLVPAAIDEGLVRRHILRWPFDANLAVAALDRTTVDMPLQYRQLYWQFRLLRHTISFPGLLPIKIMA